jgi:hypothetical protein
MFTAGECRLVALQKLAQAKQDKRHRKKLTSAAEAWLLLARQREKLEGVVAVAYEVDDDEVMDYRAA